MSHASAGAGRREACMFVCDCVRVYVNDARTEVCEREGGAAELQSLGLLLTTTWLSRAIPCAQASAGLQGISRGGDWRGDCDHTNGHPLPCRVPRWRRTSTRFRSYLASICVSEAEACTYEREGCCAPFLFILYAQKAFGTSTLNHNMVIAERYRSLHSCDARHST